MKNALAFPLFLLVITLISFKDSRTDQERSTNPHRYNVLFITADDLDENSLGCYGCGVADISPHIDEFAQQGIRFEHAFINYAICQPSRNLFASGRYGHNSGSMGFMHIHPEGSDNTIMSILKKHGYLTGVLSKVTHSTPDTLFEWDFIRYNTDLGMGRDPSLFYRHASEFFQQCRREGKPFYFMVNSDDPHRPYFNPESPHAYRRGIKSPSKLYNPEEIEVPGFVPDLPEVRKEISWYFNSVKRLDDTFGKVMLALEESGFADNTIVIFISDNGIAIPFSKANTYFASNRSPWIMRWPGVIEAGVVDKDHFISSVDFLPTVLEALQIEPPDNLDGKSFLPVLSGEKQPFRDRVYCQIDNKISGGPVPMRSVITEKFIYIFNPWSDGERTYGNNNEGLTMKGMSDAALNDPGIAQRCNLFRTRILEELYDMQRDPDGLHNLIGHPDYAAAHQDMVSKMRELMLKSHDPVLELLDNRQSPDILLDTFYRLYPKAKEADRDKAFYSLKSADY
jgi:N-sulfoglucosamine sulfohydrolase